MNILSTNPFTNADLDGAPTTYPKQPATKALNQLSIILILIGLLIVLPFGNSLSGKATILVWMLALLIGGAAIGFLFGIPKVLQANIPAQANAANTVPAYQQQVNTNLTEISDWLTKIIVGLGLVNLTKLPPYLNKLSNILSAALTGRSGNASSMALAFSYGTIIAYSLLGFLFGYITTRLYLAGAFSEADMKALRILESKVAELSGKSNSTEKKADFAIEKGILETAQNPQAAMVENPLEHLQSLVQEYNTVRATMKSSYERTTRMTKIFSRMTNLVVALENFDIAGSLASLDHGIRLSGYAYLYGKPNTAYIDQLIHALNADPLPFNQYWAILTLGKLRALMPNGQLDAELFSILQEYFSKLKGGQDRKYELSRIFPELKG